MLPYCSFPLILGIDFLNKYKFSINLENATLSHDGESFPLNMISNNVAPVQSTSESSEAINRQEFNINSSLSRAERRSLDNLLFTFTDRFSRSEHDLGQTALIRHHIQLHDTQPHKLRPLRMPQSARETINSSIQTMLETGVIRPSSSDWVSPCFLVKKKSGGYRFVVDYRRLNAKTVRDCFPIPLVEDILDNLSGCQFFSSLDLKSGYWQVSLDEDSKPLTAFQVGNALYEFNVLPFGIRNAPATFQRLLQSLFTDTNILPYIDDIVIASRTFSDHLQSLKSVFVRLREANLKLNIAKCKFAESSLVFLGHLISAEGIKPDPTKVSHLIQMRPPNSKKELESFCGFVNYLSKFIPHYSDLMQPLYRLKKETRFNWSPQCEKAFQEIISTVQQETLLHYPNYSQEFLLDTDASQVAISGVLYQSSGPLAFYSRALNKAELNYSTTDREFLALVESIEHFRAYLLGRHFQAFTDHQALISMIKRTPLNTRHARYLMKLEEFDFDLVYRKGNENVKADCLSRMVQPNITAAALSVPDESKQWVSDQAEDSETKDILFRLQKGNRAPGFSIDETGILCYYGKRVVPDSRVNDLINKYHSHGHFSSSKVRKALLGAGYWFSKMHKRVSHFLEQCNLCKMKSGPGTKVESTCLPTSPSVQPFQMLSVDIVGPLPTQRSGFRFILTIIDHCTRWLEAVPLTTVTATACATAITRNWILRYGPPQIIHSDRGSQFCSFIWKQLLSSFGIEASKTTAYNPQGNSIIERVHRTLKDRLIVSQKGWYESLQESVYAINTAVSSATGNSPFELLFGRAGWNPHDWPSITKETFKICNRPLINEYVTVRTLPQSSSLNPKFSGRFQVVSRPTPHTAVLDNGCTYNLRNLRTIS